jgi:hypothetical protein
MKLFISLLFLFTTGNEFSQFYPFNPCLQNKIYLPIYINYYPEGQPDSIKIYFTNAFQKRKIEIITKEKMQSLLKKESERIFSVIRSNDSRSESILEQVERLQQPVCNSVLINLQFNTMNNIDSIK